MTSTPDQGEQSSLLQRGVSAAAWSTIGAVARIGLQVVAQVAMARLLGPETYGLFAISLTIVLFASWFSDLGLSYGLIQRPAIDDSVIRFVFTWQVLLGLMLTAVLFGLSGHVARWFGDARLEPVVRLLSLSCTLVALGSTSSMLLRRKLDFKALNVAVVGSYAVGFLVVGMTLAFLGFGVGALIAANLLQLGLASWLTYRGEPHAIRPLLTHPDWRGILGFGTTVLVTNLLNWVMLSLDRLVIGLTMPIAAAGLYSTIGNLMIAPVTTINGVLQSALYSTSVRASDNPAQLQSALRSVLAVVMLFLAPVFVAISATSNTLVLAIYGEAWAAGGPVLRPIALAMPAFLMMGMSIPTLWASGNTRWEFNLQAPLAVLWALLLFVVGWYGSLIVLSWAVCFWFYLRAGIIAGAACRAVELKPTDALAALRPGLIVTLTVGFVALMADRIAIANPLAREAVVVLACALALAGSLVAVRPLLSREVLQLFETAIRWLPGGIGQTLAQRVFKSKSAPDAGRAPR